jgi:uncharacterized protein YndB with AHSA1/START domain
MATTNSETFQITTPSDFEFVITRQFNAPRELVWEAWTKPEHVRKWWGCNESTMTVCEIDLRVDGAWRYVMQLPDGSEFGFNGVFREVSPHARLVHTSIFEPMPQHPSLVTVALEERDGKTILTETTHHNSTEARDGHLHSGLDVGARQSLDRLEEYVGSLALVA